MADRKTVVVDIISDSKKFLSGFEESIKAIEKVAKKTDILGGMKDDIDELRDSINSIEKGMSKIKPEIDDSAIKGMQNQITSLSGKIKTLKSDIKDIKIQVDTSTGEELVKLFNKINAEFNRIKSQAQIFKGLGIGLETNNINSNIEKIDKLKQSIEELTLVQNNLREKSSSNFEDISTKEAQKQLDELIVKYNKLIESMSDDDVIKTGAIAKDIKALQSILGKSLIPDKELNDVLLAAMDTVEDKISNIRSQISKISSEIGAEISTFEVKDGKISVKLDLSTTSAQLKKTALDTLSQVQDSLNKEPLLVPLRFTSNYKTKVTEELDELDKIAQGMRNSKAKDEITKQVENLRKQILDRDFKLEFKTNLPELLNNIIKPDISEIQKILKESKLYLYPQLKIDDESENAIKKQIENIFKNIKIDLGISNINLDSIVGKKEIDKFNEQLKKLQINISPTVDLTDKDIEKINKNLTSKLDKFHIEVNTVKLQEGLKSAIDTSLIDNWRSKFITAIDDVCVKIEKSFDKASKGQFYETMKNWSEADKIMRDYRTGSTNSHGSNTLFERNASGELERKAYANSKTGTISNSYIVDQFGSVSNEIKTQLKKLYNNVKNIGEIYDTSLHSHPVSSNKGINTDKVLRDDKIKPTIINQIYDNILSQLTKGNIDVSNGQQQKNLKNFIDSFYKQLLSSTKNIRGADFVEKFNNEISNLFGDIVSINSSDLFNIIKNSIQGNESKFLTTITKGKGSDLTFSPADLLSYNNERINDGIKKIMIESSGKINELDLSTVDDRIVKAIIDEYSSKINSTISSQRNDYITTDKNGVKTIDYSKRAEISNKLLADIIEQQITSFNKSNKTNYSSSASDYLKQYDVEALKLNPEDIVKEQQEISKLIQLLTEMSTSLTEINKKDFKLNTDSIDTITKQIQSLLDAIRELGTQFKTVDVANVNISIEPFERIITTLQELSNTFTKAFNPTTSSKEEIEVVSNLSKKLQDVIKKIKEKNELFEKEYKIVAKTIPEETEKIGKLVSALNYVSKILTEINGLCKGLDFSNLNSLGQLNKLKADKIGVISTSLSLLSDSINNLNLKDGNILDSLQVTLEKADELKSLASILKESKDKISEVDKAIKSTDKDSEKKLNEKYSILKDDLKEILRLSKEYAKADPYTKEDIKQQIAQYQDRADTIQLEIWELDKINDIEQNRVDILREQIALEETAQQNKNLSILEKQEANNDAILNSLREQNEYLEKDSNAWSHALDLLYLYKNELKDIVNITRNVRLDEKTGFRAISYKFTDSDGSSKTVGANGDLLIDNSKIVNLTELYTKLKKSVNEYYSAQSKIIKGDKSDKTQTESLQAYNTMLQVQREIAYWKLRGLEPSKEQLLIEQKILSITSTLKDQQKQSGLDNMYQTVLNTITRLNKKTKEVNDLKLKSDGSSEFVESIKNAQDHVSTLIGTLRGFKFSDFFSQDALNSFGLDGDALLFDNGDLNSLKWVVNQLPLTEAQLHKINDVLDENVKIAETNISLQNKISEKQKLNEENARKKEAAENLEMINNSLLRQYELTNKIHSLEQSGRLEEAKVLNNELVEEIKNCESLVAGYKTFNDIVEDVNADLQQVFKSHKFDYDVFNAKVLDDKNAKRTEEITKHNKDLIKNYKELEKSVTTYFELAEKKVNNTATNAELNKIKDIEEAWDKAINKKNEYSIQTGGNINTENEAKKVQDAFINSQSTNYSYIVDKYVQNAQKNITKLGQGDYTDTFIIKLNEAQELINKINSNPLDPLNQDDLKRVSELKTLLDKIDVEKEYKTNRIANENSVIKLQRNIYAELDKNSAMSKTLRLELEKLGQELSDMGHKIPLDEFDKFKNRFVELQMEINKAGNLGKSFFSLIGSKIKGMSASFIAQYLSFYDFARYLGQAYQYVADIDAKMIELEKVSDMSDARLAQSFNHATEAAKDLGSTISDVVSATADWSRLGYDADAAEELAEVAILYKNVGDGIDISTANDSLISTLQGFQMDADKAIEIVDKFNEVANRMPIDSAGIGEALRRSAASFNVANTSLSESISLITATNAVIQDPTSVGTMWKTVSARIRGAKTELEEMGEDTEGMVESTSKLRDLVKGMTGFDIMEDENTFKSIYDIIVGIGKEWDNLNDIDRAGLLEALAGKRAGNALAAAIQNYEMIEEAYQIAENSSGSAMKEQEKWEQGLEARTNKLKASLEELSTTILDSDFLGGLIDTGRGAIEIITEIIDKLGVIPTLLTAIGAGFGIKKSLDGGGRAKCCPSSEYATGEFSSDVYELCIA